MVKENTVEFLFKKFKNNNFTIKEKEVCLI